MRCCSAKLFSLFTFRCSAAKIVRLSSNATPHARFNTRSSSLPIPFLSTLASAPGVVIEKYSSSSRSTMMACLVNKGFWADSGVDDGDREAGEAGLVCASTIFFCAWKRPGVVGVP
jgi:hypothetical protein